MAFDIKAMLHRVVAEVFDEAFIVADASSIRDPWLHGVRVSRADMDRAAIIRASYEWIDAGVPELDVGAVLIDYDDDGPYKEAMLRSLCLAMRAYLRGDGRIEHRRRIFRRGTVPVLIINLDGHEWRLGRRSCSVPYPEGST